MKVSKTVKERFKITGSGKILHSRSGVKHRRSKESTELKARGRRLKKLKGPEERKIRQILGIPKGRR